MTLTANTNGTATLNSAPAQTAASSSQNDMTALLAEMRKLIQGPESKGQHGTLRVGVSYGLLEYLVTNQKENQVATSFKTSLFSGDSFIFKAREVVENKDNSKLFIEELQQMAAERGSALEVNIGLSFVEIDQLANLMADGLDGVPLTYATFEVELLGTLEGKKRLVKDVTTGTEEEKFFLKAGSVKFLGNINQASNPLGDDSILCTKKEFKAGMVKTFDKAREGFNTWRDARNAAQESSPAPAAEGPSISNLLGTITTA